MVLKLQCITYNILVNIIMPRSQKNTHWCWLPLTWFAWHCLCLHVRQQRKMSHLKVNCYLINTWHPNISMQILHTVLYTFPRELTRRICVTIKIFFQWWLYPLFLWPYCVIWGWYCREKLDISHPQGSKDKEVCFKYQTAKRHTNEIIAKIQVD